MAREDPTRIEPPQMGEELDDEIDGSWFKASPTRVDVSGWTEQQKLADVQERDEEIARAHPELVVDTTPLYTPTGERGPSCN